MTKLKEQMLRLIEKGAAAKAADFASQLARAAPAKKEQILAGLEFERWLAEMCEECLQKPPTC